MIRFRHHSISRRLTLMNVLVSGVALVLAGVVFFAYDLITLRETMIRDLSIQAEIIGSNSVSALLFDDAKSAKNTVSALNASPNIAIAAIYGMDGKPFASYLRDRGAQTPSLPAIAAGETQTYSFGNGRLELANVIVFQGKPTGTVYIQSDLREMYARLKRYAAIVTGVLVLSLLAALLVSSVSRRAIIEPVEHLAEIANAVSHEKNYSVRATPTGHGDEFSVLIRSFNEMLAQIQERDAALEEAREKLERRVEERTAELAAANKELEAFSYSVSHDLRAPLRHIDGFSGILANKFGPAMDPAAQQYLSRIRDSAKHMGQLIDDLLNMARIGRQELVRKPVDANLLVQEVMRSLKPECEGRQIQWKLEKLSMPACDPNLMKLVFTNLLSNAVKYTRRTERAVIEVGQTIQNGTPVVFVRDNGAGFEQQYAHKLFGVFQRLHRAEDFEGTGVGLATVQRVIQ